MNTKNLLIVAAVASLMGTTAIAAKKAEKKADKAAATGECAQTNECKGKGGCKTAANECGGKNSCANHKFETTEAKCKEAKGTFAAKH